MFSFDLKWEMHQKRKDILSWLTVSLALVPEAIAFALIAQIPVLFWLYAAAIIWLITSVFWWRAGMISWATWAMAVVIAPLITETWNSLQSLEYLLAAVVLAWIFQMLAWFFKIWKFIRLVPHPVMLWFVNGLAIVIFLAQMEHFQVENSLWKMELLSGSPLFIMLWLIALTMAIIHFFPKITKTIPSSLVAIFSVTVLVVILDLDTKIVKEMSSISWAFPPFKIPSVWFNLETFYIIFPYSLTLAAVWLIESLLTLTLIDEITETRWDTNRECLWQWFANTVCGFFWWMWGCAMIWQSIININSGGRWRLSGISAALFLFSFILFLSEWIELIPIAALVWVMFIVVISTFARTSLKIINKIPKSDAFVLIFVSAVTVFTDLAIAVVSWVIISALVFAWKRAKEISAEIINEENKTIYQLKWPLFFWSIHNFNEIFDVKKDKKEVIIDFLKTRVYDHSWVEAIDSLTKKYKKAWKKLHLKHLSPNCRELLQNAKEIIDINLDEDPNYSVAYDKNS